MSGNVVELQIHLLVSFLCRELRESGQGLYPLCVWNFSMDLTVLTHSRDSVKLDMCLVRAGRETETMESSFAQQTAMFLELWLLLLEVIGR